MFMQKFVSFTNILDDEWVGQYGGEQMVFQAGETVKLPEDVAKAVAVHLARQIYDTRIWQRHREKAIKLWKLHHEVRVTGSYTSQEFLGLIDLVLGEKKVDYTGYKATELRELAEKHDIKTRTDDGKFKTKEQIIKELNNL